MSPYLKFVSVVYINSFNTEIIGKKGRAPLKSKKKNSVRIDGEIKIRPDVDARLLWLCLNFSNGYEKDEILCKSFQHIQNNKINNAFCIISDFKNAKNLKNWKSRTPLKQIGVELAFFELKKYMNSVLRCLLSARLNQVD